MFQITRHFLNVYAICFPCCNIVDCIVIVKCAAESDCTIQSERSTHAIAIKLPSFIDINYELEVLHTKSKMT